MYLVAALVWACRRLLMDRVSIAMAAAICLEAMREAAARWRGEEIVNTDQGSPYSSGEFVAEVKRIGARQSMAGKGCGRDIVFVKRPVRGAKYEGACLKAYDGVNAARHVLAAYFAFYDVRRRHQSLDGRTPDMIYFNRLGPMHAAAC